MGRHRIFGLHLLVFSFTFLFPGSSQQEGQEWCATTSEHLAQGFTNGSCFRYFTSENLSREAAKTRCSSFAPDVTGDLAQIPSQFAQVTLYRNLLRYMSPKPRNLWISARGYTSPEWRWSDGRPFAPLTFSNWAQGEPPTEPSPNSKYCAFVNIADPSLQWRVDNCGVEKQFICEYKSPQNRPNGYQFVALSYKLDWYSAKIECQREGGQMMDMTTLDQFKNWQNVTAQMIETAGGVGSLPAQGAVWLGLNRQIWMWDSSDKEVAWSNFSSVSLIMEPVQDCVYLSVDLDWVATSCSAQLNFMCQFAKTTLTTTTTAAMTTEETTPGGTTMETTIEDTTMELPDTTLVTQEPSDANGTTLVPQTPSTPSTPQTPSTAAPIVKSSTTPVAQAVAATQSLEPYMIAIIVICVICFIVIVVAIVVACCGFHRRRVATADAYVAASPSPSVTKASPVQVDVSVTAHPLYSSQCTGTSVSNIDMGDPNRNTVINVVPAIDLKTGADDDDYGLDNDEDTLSLPQSSRVSASVGGGACYSLDEPPNDIPEVYTSPTFLYSFPSHRPLEPVAPHRIDDMSTSGSSNLSRSPSSTTSPPPPLLPPRVPIKQVNPSRQAPPPLPKKTPPSIITVSMSTPQPQAEPQHPPTPPPPFRPPANNASSASTSSRRFDEVVNV